MMDGGGHEGGHVPDDVDRLIELGLDRYGKGDVNGALMAWERALAIDPDDARAAAYVDYVRENYELLAGTPRPDHGVPFGLGATPVDDDEYEVEVAGMVTTPAGEHDEGVPLELAAEPEVAPPASTRAPSEPPQMDTGAVERYIESVDEGWFLGDETPTPVVVSTPPGRATAPGYGAGTVPAPASPRQLPLPANPSQGTGEITVELEADEPDPSGDTPLELAPLEPAPVDPEPPRPVWAVPASEDERTGAFRGPGGWPRGSSEVDFADQRSAAPTQEISAPRGFIRARSDAPPPTFEPDDDRLLTRPGRSPGGPLDTGGALPRGVAPEAIGALGGRPPGSNAVGPDELTRESPLPRVTFSTDTQDLTPPPDDTPLSLELEGDDERTQERSSLRPDTLGEQTTERSPGRGYTRPDPLDEPAGAPTGAHPPLVIIDDPVLAGPEPEPAAREPEPDVGPPPVAVDLGLELGPDGTPSRRRPASDKHRAPTVDPAIAPPLSAEDLSPGTRRPRRSSAAPAPGPGTVPATMVSIDDLSRSLDAEVEANALPDESRADRTRRRVTDLIDRSIAASRAGNHATAIVALDLALAEEPDSAIAQKLLHRHQPAILDVYQSFLGDLARRPALAMPMHELAGEKLDIRAAFLLSRIDGNLTFDEILDVSGMQRAEAFRHLSNLMLRGILTVA